MDDNDFIREESRTNQRYERRENHHFGFGNVERRARFASRDANFAERKRDDNFRRLSSRRNDRTQSFRRRKEVRIMKNWIPVRCHVEKVSEVFPPTPIGKRFCVGLKVCRTTPKTVFTTHGEPDAAEAMAEHIHEEFGWNVHVPSYDETYPLV